MKKVTIKEVLTSRDTWIITKVMQGYNGSIRIDARRRFTAADGVNFFSEWTKKNYVNRVRRDAGLNEIEITQY